MRYHKIDGWRGYSIPTFAVAGASDTGEASDSPCRTSTAQAEIKRFRDEVLKPAGIKSRISCGQTSNVFCVKHWVVVSSEDFERAVPLTLDWIEKQGRELELIDDADLKGLAKQEVA